MRPINKYWLFAVLAVTATLVVFVVTFIPFWTELADAEKAFFFSLLQKHFIYLFGALVLAVAGIGFALDAFFNTFILPLIKLSEETNIITTVNPTHRIQMEAAKEVQKLIAAINELADHREERENEVQTRISTARAQSEQEKNILAVFMSELSEGVLICNQQGVVTFFNRQARHFFEIADRRLNRDSPDHFIGIGRSVFDIIDKQVITSALDEISEKLEQPETEAAAHFMVPDQKGHLIQVEAAPVLSTGDQFAGFLLIFKDISSQIAVENYLHRQLRTLSGQTRSSLAGIRTAVESLRAYPEMPRTQGAVFQEIIHKEVLALGEVLDKVSIDSLDPVASRWPLMSMPLIPLLISTQQKALDRIGIHLGIPMTGEDVWVRCDRYTLTLSLLYLLKHLRDATGANDFSMETAVQERLMQIDFFWFGRSITTDLLKKWEDTALAVGTEVLPLTLRDVLGHHHGELCTLRGSRKDRSAIRLFLPVSQSRPGDVKRKLRILPKSRPEFFDFDLFHRAGQTPELERMPLRSITYTVFDTETTGLNPNGGDKIIAIGATRIVNGRLLKSDTFDQLIDPKRPLSEESIRIHGILQHMLEGKPQIDAVLPRFGKYCEKTVLVAHNAAFDLKMLQAAERQSGVSLINPVLDTLLLSAIVHPAQRDHTLEAIAQRLGVEIIARHTALGDALITGQLFLKLIPLLEKRGVHTLGEALQASYKTYFARLKY